LDLLVIAIVALLTSWLTLLSGFGLGTLLLPVFALFFEVEVAIALTAIVHVLNNLFKFGLLAKWVNRGVVLWFGVPGILGAFLGVRMLSRLSHLDSWFVSDTVVVDPLSAVIGVLMIFFALTELFPKMKQFSFKRNLLALGGIFSGFFGGLSGHQGALRSMFLIKAGLSKEVYIATGVAIALLIDFTRIPMYLMRMPRGMMHDHWAPVIIATGFAFFGALVGKRMMKKVTFRFVQILVGIMMIGIGFGLILGVF